MTKPGLGRLPAPDQRDEAYPILTLLGTATPQSPLTRRYWHAGGWWGDQGATSQCVAYGWTHWLEDGPVTHRGDPPIVDPAMLYHSAQLVDEWPGEGYDGTSVRAGAKVLQDIGWIESYHWAFDVDTIVETLLGLGPVVIGTNWYESMFEPDSEGILRIEGPLAGGHCTKLDGVSKARGMVRLKNSWGRSWGVRGFGWLPFEALERLISEDGEACIAIERAVGGLPE